VTKKSELKIILCPILSRLDLLKALKLKAYTKNGNLLSFSGQND
jgi:hypothetical protein